MVYVSLRDMVANDNSAELHGAEPVLLQRGGRRHAHPGWRKPAIVAIAALAAIAAAGFVLDRLLGDYHDGITRAGLTSDARPLTIVVAGTRLTIPANLVRFRASRHDGPADRIDMLLLWPELDGFSEARADAFKSDSPTAPLIFATIGPQTSGLDTDERLSAVYSRFFTGNAVAGPAGLAGRRLSDDSGYRGEIVYFSPEGAAPFAARCLGEATAEMPATCMREVALGKGLALLYRFNLALLQNWQDMDARLRERAAAFLAAP